MGGYKLKLELEDAHMNKKEAVLLQEAFSEQQDVSITVTGKLVSGETHAMGGDLQYYLVMIPSKMVKVKECKK